MNSVLMGKVTPEIERAMRFCEYMLPIYRIDQFNPLDALKTGEANCVVRAFVVATALGEIDEKLPSTFIHRGDKRSLGTVMTLYDGSVISGQNSEVLTIGPIKPESSLYNGGLVICGDPSFGIKRYLEINPGLPEVPDQDIIDARELILDSL